MRRYMVFVPVLCTFGPLEMVLGYETPYHLLSLVAGLITSVGILVIFANVMQLIGESGPTDHTAQNGVPSHTRTAVIVAVCCLAIVGGGAFYLMAGARH
jgi:hypothetical protein